MSTSSPIFKYKLTQVLELYPVSGSSLGSIGWYDVGHSDQCNYLIVFVQHFTQNYNELQLRIDTLKKCGNGEIKMLKTRIQILEKHIKQMIPQTCVDGDEYKENETYFIDIQIQCKYGENTPIKLCPHILRIIKVNEIYNKILSESNTKVCFMCARIKTNVAHI